MYRFALVAIIGLLVVAGCSRKGNEQLPPRVGDLLVKFIVNDEAGLPQRIPVTVAVYSDFAHTAELRSEQVVTMSDSLNIVELKGMAAISAYVVISIDQNIAYPTCTYRPHYAVFVQQGRVSTTPIITMTVRQQVTECEP